MPRNTVKIIQPEKPDDQVPFAVLAIAIRDLAAVSEKIKQSGLTDRAVDLLLSDLTKMSRSDVRKVLNALPKLSQFVKDKKQ